MSVWLLRLLEVWRGKASRPLLVTPTWVPGHLGAPAIAPRKADAGWTRWDHGSREACFWLGQQGRSGALF